MFTFCILLIELTGVMRHLIGHKIRELRKKKRLTLQKLAELTGLTKGYLSRIENSAKPPPIYTLSRICSALEIDMGILLSDNKVSYLEIPEIVLNKADEHIITNGRGTPYGYIYEALAVNKPGKNMVPFLVTVGPKKRGLFQHEGEEFIYVLEGELEFYFKDQTFVLKKGDSVYFDSMFPHGGRSLGKSPAKMLVVIYSYKRI